MFATRTAFFFAVISALCSGFSVVTPTAATGSFGITSKEQKAIPITVLSGFLGSGKTTLLRNLLENNEGLRIAVVVNDVASVNIDSKLVSSENKAAGMVELQNGCACCSRSEELLASVAELVTMNDMRAETEGFHHIVIEMSGVGDPRSVRAKFQEALMYDMPLMQRVNLDTMVTLIDCSTFVDQLKSSKIATPDETPELYYRDTKEAEEDRTWQRDLPPGLLEALQAGDRSGASGVADLLVSQTEIADIVLINKIDLVENQEKLDEIEEIIEALNPRATVMKCKFGNIPLRKVLAVAKGEGVVEAGVIDDHRDAVEAVNVMSRVHDAECSDPDCTDTSHSHSHNHAPVSSGNQDLDDSAHIDSHDHAEFSDPSHSHQSESRDGHHSHSHDHSCDDPTCTDPGHSHNHGVHADIGSFVYRARRPFHPGRLVSFLRNLPVKRGVPEQDTEKIAISSGAHDSLQNVLRSKGFVWCADSDIAANYWSQAGSSFEMSNLGRWWSTLSRDQWPQEAVDAILQDFDNREHDEATSNGESVGDRRQEIVFIGPTLGDKRRQNFICSVLDKCLLDDGEWTEYNENRKDDEYLKRAFENPLIARIMVL